MTSNEHAGGAVTVISKNILRFVLVAMLLVSSGVSTAFAAEYAALVMDARNGKVLHSENADKRLHPASLTKMMTLYIAFEAVEHGEIGLDDLVTVSRNAASEPPSKLGLKAGQKIRLRYLLRAAAVKSANDAATAIGEAIEGSEAAFARRMNRTAQALGMSRTTFKNAHGLTESGHLSTARDMTILGRHVFYDFPEYYNLFSRKTADAGVRTVNHTNTRFLNAYRGADGIKTGYTSAAGFNLVASAHRGSERIITTVFGGRSTATRNAKVAELMDLGFRKAPTQVAVAKPTRPPYMGKTNGTVVVAQGSTTPSVASKIVRVSVKVDKSPIPSLRPRPALAPEAETMLVAMSDDISEALVEDKRDEIALAAAEEAATLVKEIEEIAAAVPQNEDAATPAVGFVSLVPTMRPDTGIQLASADPVAANASVMSDAPSTTQVALANVTTVAATASVSNVPTTAPSSTQEVVTRLSTSGSRHWGVNIGTYGSDYEARKVLLKTALAELDMLDGALRKVVRTNRGFNANFMGLTEDMAEVTCRRLEARGTTCNPIGPSS